MLIYTHARTNECTNARTRACTHARTQGHEAIQAHVEDMHVCVSQVSEMKKKEVSNEHTWSTYIYVCISQVNEIKKKEISNEHT